jgi:hypothetical protein
MAELDARARVIEEWFRLPESRRLYATDAVAFVFRLLQERPEVLGRMPPRHEIIVGWLLPYLHREQAG